VKISQRDMEDILIAMSEHRDKEGRHTARFTEIALRMMEEVPTGKIVFELVGKT
jgi:hypothetical protein